MLNPFQKKTNATPQPELKAFFERITRPMSSATAMADVVGRHAASIRAGEVPFPVLEADNTTTVQRWHHFRLEACLRSIRYGNGSLLELADFRNQPRALAELLDHKSHLALPQPSGSAMAQSIQGMWQAYLYLSKWGTKLGDPETDRLVLSGRSIIACLECEAVKAQQWWSKRTNSPEAIAEDMPPTLFDLFFNDLNRKTKSVVLSKLLGPDHAKGAVWFIEEMRKAHGEHYADQLCQFLDVLNEADNPDQAVEHTAQLIIARHF